MFIRSVLLLSTSVGCVIAAPIKDIQFRTLQLNDKFWSEGANFGDFNHDGKKDIVSGPYWYEGPDFTNRHEYADATETFKHKKADGTEEAIPGFEGAFGENNAYSKNFFAFTCDFNSDGWDDILILGFPGELSWWYENPGKGAKGKGLFHHKKGQSVPEGHWIRHDALEITDNESPTFEDITGDRKPEIVCMSKGAIGYAQPDWKNPTNKFTWHPISPNNNYHRFTHGFGIGDVNGDGRRDILEKSGWWEQPASLAGDPIWKKHEYPFAPEQGGAQMYAYDVNGDGLNDVITSLNAHAFGLAWYEQVRTNGEITFKKHEIMGKTPNDHGVVFSQLHAIDLVDMNHDGIKDIVTGKRFWAHGKHGDADPTSPPVLYWFELRRDKTHNVDFIPHLIHNDSGIGTQVIARDINGDSIPDIVVGNKKGTFVHLSEKARKK